MFIEQEKFYFKIDSTKQKLYFGLKNVLVYYKN